MGSCPYHGISFAVLVMMINTGAVAGMVGGALVFFIPRYNENIPGGEGMGVDAQTRLIAPRPAGSNPRRQE